MTELHKPDIRKANSCPPCPTNASAWEKCVYWLGIGLGSGLPKRAAGTWGTVGGLIVAIPMLWLGFWGFLAITILGCLVGSYICGKTSDLMGVHDDPHIVFDEWVGMWISLLPVVFNVWLSLSYKTDYIQQTVIGFILSFILFRFFDILKPFPIKWVDKNVGGGFGILVDDILAGVMAVISLISLGILAMKFFY